MSDSYWTKILQPVSSSAGTATYDFIVIGAGIAGVSTAFWLEKKYPKQRVVVIDQSSIAAGASGRNAGFMTCGSALHFDKLQKKFGLGQAYKIWNFSEINHRLLLNEIIQDDPDQVDYKKTGSVTVIPNGSEPRKFQNIMDNMKSVGISVEKLSEKDLKSQYAVKESQGGIEYLHDGVVHPVKLILKIKSRLKNTDFIFNEQVLNLQKNEVLTVQRKYQAQSIFVCLNGYSGKLVPKLSDLIKPQRGQIILTEPQPPLIKGPCYLTQHLCYFRQLPSGEILIGGFRNLDPDSENTMQDEITTPIQNALENFAKTYFHQTGNIKINYRWSGIMGFTPDDMMIVGAHPYEENVYIMAGCAGHGMGLSFLAAKNMVEENVPDFFDIQRFNL